VYASDLQLGRRRWDWSSQLVFLLAWLGLVTVCVGVVLLGAGIGYGLWWLARWLLGGVW
jgi:hypothetical protein